ncbi:hypothetical protein BDB00DRAFT_882300 [Zychaea mexicana]|uniref:uncharacterized protein n=1 Tax=Zychaea mexicana TaxID=64656 RepID=UPI0022FE2FF7|nr:uncharacterized protein BDB00DRAFT_882300 [Zychaea mexicana]KAI9495857.1 hypothetical protein BDB00DRAFT_882300 [Zychaea mexicana]
MASTHPSALFQPIKLGNAQLKHRIVMPPMARLRATADHIPTDLMREYYEQRATDGGLIIAEGSVVSPIAGGYRHAPGIWSEEQIAGWKAVTDAVHAKGGIIYNQIWHPGRATFAAMMPDNAPPIAPSAIAASGKSPLGIDWETPQEMTPKDILDIKQDFVTAAKNAVNKAGFDGIEIHAATGFLVDQFIRSSSNVRTDQYGGSIENRSRFLLELVDDTVAAIGAERTAIRLSPFDNYMDMEDDTPLETFGYIVEQLKKKHPKLSHIHMIEPRLDLWNDDSVLSTENTLDSFREKWGADGVFISSGGYTYSPKLAEEVADATGNLISFGRLFTSNPDLVERLRNGWSFTKYDRSTFYGGDGRGLTDFTVYDNSQQQNQQL